MARVKRGVAAKKRHKKVLEQAKGYYGNKSRSFRAANEQVMHSGPVRVPRPAGQEGRVPPPVDPADQRCLPPERHELQPVHRRAQRGRHRSRPQDPRRSRRHRRRRVRAARRASRQGSALNDPLGVQQRQGPTAAAPPRAPQFAFRRRCVRRRGPPTRRRSARRRVGDRGRVRRRRRRLPSTGPMRSCSPPVSSNGSRRPTPRSRSSPSYASRQLRSTLDGRPASSLVADRIADPGNLGTILRSAEAAGVDGVVLTAGSVDPFNPKVVRASAGALFHVPVLDADLDVGSRPSGCGRSARRRTEATPHTEADLTGRIALVVGNEAHGLPDDVAGRRVGDDPPSRAGREPQRGDGCHGRCASKRRASVEIG